MRSPESRTRDEGRPAQGRDALRHPLRPPLAVPSLPRYKRSARRGDNSPNISHIQNLLEKLRENVKLKENNHLKKDIHSLITVLQCPVFGSILTIQESLNELKNQLSKHPSILPVDFQISPATGQLLLNIPPEPSQAAIPSNSDSYEPSSDPEQNYEFDFRSIGSRAQPDPDGVVSLSEQFVKSEPDYVNLSAKEFPGLLSSQVFGGVPAADAVGEDYYSAIREAAEGREVHTLWLHKAENTSLGFSVVGLKGEHSAGIFVENIQEKSIAARDGRLQEGDQILAIDRQLLNSDISHEKAINILKRVHGTVEFVVARGSLSIVSELKYFPSEPDSAALVESASGEVSDSRADMVLNTEWAQVEAIDLVNDGTGLGFGIIGGRSTGVIVKTIVPGGVSDRDGRLQSGDHILHIGEVNLRGMGSEQVAQVLRQAGTQVRLIVARPIDPSADFTTVQQGSAPIVPTRVLADAEAVERHLALFQQPTKTGNVAPPAPVQASTVAVVIADAPATLAALPSPAGIPVAFEKAELVANGHDSVVTSVVANGQQQNTPDDHQGLHATRPCPPTSSGASEVIRVPVKSISEPLIKKIEGRVEPVVGPLAEIEQLPEMETFEVELVKDQQGLGITIAGYVCEKEEISGIFVKSIASGSAADLCKKIVINDQIIEVDGRSLYGYTNHEAVEVLRSTGKVVKLRLARYLRGTKYEQLQHAIASTDIQPLNQQQNQPRVPGSTIIQVETQILAEEVSTPGIALYLEQALTDQGVQEMRSASGGDSTLLYAKWRTRMGPNYTVIVAQIQKFKESGGLGISLEGTVDIEDGKEVRPHHYIRAILPDGPVGVNGLLRSGDEILEVNGKELVSLNHVEVVSLLKELPVEVEMACARPALGSIVEEAKNSANTMEKIQPSFLENLHSSSGAGDRLVKAKSDGSLAVGTSATCGVDLSKLKSRSLEPLTGLAMWSSEPQIIELVKGERGLGFSILDYQDPMNPSETVIVIRSLVPGGVAQQDGRLIPGDRLVFVNEVNLENASLDVAVQALKGAPKGVVRIGVAKPLPLPECNSHQSPSGVELRKRGSDPDVDPIHRTSVPVGEHSFNSSDQSLPQFQEQEEEDEEENVQELLCQEMASIASAASIPDRRFATSAPPPPSFSPFSDGDGIVITTDSRSSTPLELLSTTVYSASLWPLPTALERTAKVKKASDPLGISLELADRGVNGMVVKAISQSGSVYKDGRIQVGDYLTALNNESLRNITNSQARAILRRAQLLTTDIILKYVPESDVTIHKQSAVLSMQQQEGHEDRHRLPNYGRESPSLLPMLRRTPSPSSPYFGPRLSDSEADDDARDPRLGSTSSSLFESVPVVAKGRGRARTRGSHQMAGRGVSVPPKVSSLSASIELLQGPRASSGSRYSASAELLLEPERSETLAMPSLGADSVITAAMSASSGDSVRSESPSVSDSNRASQDLEQVSSSSPQVPPRAPSASSPSVTEPSGSKSRSSPLLSEAISASLCSSTSSPSTTSGSSTLARQWASPKTVQLFREPDHGLGISIVGGKVDMFNMSSGNSIAGIFIKNVLTESPAGRSGQVKRGDRILEVGSVDLREATHDQAVETIKNAQNPIPFLIQSLLPLPRDTETVSSVKSTDQQDSSSSSTITSATLAAITSVMTDEEGFSEKDMTRSEESVSLYHSALGEASESSDIHLHIKVPSFEAWPPPRTPSPEVIQQGIPDEEKQQLQAQLEDAKSQLQEVNDDHSDQEKVADTEKRPSLVSQESEESDDDGPDERQLQGKIINKHSVEIDRASAGNIKVSSTEKTDDEDSFGYTLKKIERKYGDLTGSLNLVELQKGLTGLGLSLAGNKDRKKMSVFVCGMHPNGSAAKDGRVQVGDEILEVNGTVVHGRCHLNASATIKSLSGPVYKIIVLRREGALNEMAVKPLTQFPVHLEEEGLEEKFSKYTGVRTVTVRKSPQGLGIMIIEGKHTELGRGVFVSDIQESSPAEQAGLAVGDMILCVNQTDLIGADYDTAASSLKNAEGLLSIVVVKPSKVSAKEGALIDEGAKGEGIEKKEKSIPPPPPPKPPHLHLLHKTSKHVKTPSNGSANGSLSQVVPKTAVPSVASSTSCVAVVPNSDGKTQTTSHSFFAHGNAPPEPTPDPKTCEVLSGLETTIEVTKEKMGLGLSIVGGSDTPLAAVIIHEVYPDGAAALDGRLKPGDVILQVNEENLRSAPHEQAIAALRQTPSLIKMVVFREDGHSTDTDLYDILELELHKKPGKGLGLSIVGRKNGPGVYVSEVVKGGVAEADGRLLQGDHILEVNGNDLRSASHEYAAAILKTTMGKISMKIGRLKAGSRHSTSETAIQSKSENDKPSDVSLYKEITLKRGPEGLGFSIVGGRGSPQGNFPIYIKQIFEKGAAAEEGQLRRGDQIVAVNEESLEGVTHEEAVEILKTVTGSVKLTVITGQ